MDYRALATLIQTHPQWPSVTDADLVVWCRDEVISRDRPTLPAGEVFASILNNISEWNALTDNDRSIVRDVLYVHSGEGVPTAPGTPARAVLVSLLGTATKSELAGSISEMVSRAVDAGIPGEVRESDVAHARETYT